jgi:hypothetical protein
MQQHAPVLGTACASICWGTGRTEDLLKAFAGELYRLDRANALWASTCSEEDWDAWVKKVDAHAKMITLAKGIDPKEDDAFDLVFEFMEALETYAPPLCYFGANEGGGTDYGFWPNMEDIEELPGIKDNSDEDIKAAFEDHSVSYCRWVNDHGNVTVYDRSGKPVLELV